ncbi:MAG TPA: hypothetical protein VKS22_08180 [Candidatus Binataceae bacterium]|nr:hypothetical protein [Candidatus Binataceae bacterium]
MKIVGQALLSIVLLMVACSAPAWGNAADAAGAESEEDQLAGEVDDPTAILTQLKFQDFYTPGSFETSAQTNTVQLQAVIPTNHFSLIPFQQVIRPTFKLQTFATSEGSDSKTGFADMELLDLFISNWPDPKRTGFGWAVGPTFVFPTGQVPGAGKRAWEVGPAAAAVYRGVPHLMLGVLFQNPISFAYTNPAATPQSQMKLQPLISYTLGHGWYVKSADSTWTVNWRHGGSTTIPISSGFGKVWRFAGPELNTWVSGEWTAYRQFAGITPRYTVRFGLTVALPQVEL